MVLEKSLHFSDQTYAKHAISFIASRGKESVKRGTHEWAVNAKTLTPIYFQD